MNDKSSQNDPQMQDILGSIRRIISEDNEQPARGAAARGDEEILELTEEVGSDESDSGRLGPTVGMAAVETDEPEIRREPILGLHRPVAPQPPVDAPPAPAEEEAAAAPEKGPIPSGTIPEEAETPVEEIPPAAPEPAGQPAPMVAESAVREIVSETTTAATTSALGELTRAMEEKTSKLKVGSGDATISDIVKEMLRPMLREWLDENLPGIVERVVRREIQKLVDRAEADD